MLQRTPQTSGSGTGQYSREVLFRLGVVPDPAAATIARQFGDIFVREHNRISGVATMRAKDITEAYANAGKGIVNSFADVNTKGSQSLNKLADTSALRAKDFQAAWKSATDSVQARLNNVATSAAGVAGTGVNARMGGGAGGGGGGGSLNYGSGMLNVIQGGAHIAKGVALSGLAGEQDTQKILDTLLKVEAGIANLAGVIQVGKGIGMLGGFGGGAAGGAGLAGLTAIAIPVAAAAAAALATGAAGKIVHEQVTGRASGDNSWSMAVGRGLVNSDAWVRGAFGNDFAGADIFGTKDVMSSRSRLSGQSAAATAWRTEADARFGHTSKLFAARDADLGEAMGRNADLGRARGTAGLAAANSANRGIALEEWREAHKISEQIRASSVTTAAEKDGAARREREWAERFQALVVETGEIQKRSATESLQSAREALQVSERHRDSLKERAKLAAHDADVATGKYKSDLVRFGEASAVDQGRVKQAAGLLRGGGQLSREQEAMLEPYGEFRDELEQRRMMRGAAAGGVGLFQKGLAGANAAAMAMQQAAQAVQKAELTVKGHTELVVRYEANTDTDPRDQKIIEQISEVLAGHRQREQEERNVAIRNAIAQLQGSRGAAIR